MKPVALAASGVVFLFLFSLLAFADGEAGSIIASPANGPAPLRVDFTFRTNLNVTSYSWDFDGDGAAESVEQDPSYTFPVEGRYLVTLTTIDNSGLTSTFTKSITVTSAMAVSVTATPSSGAAPLAVQFSSVSTGRDPITYAWDFNGDGTVDNTQQNPLKTFDNPGAYNVTLTVTDGSGSTVSKVIPIIVTAFDSKLELKSYFPTSLNQGENQITFLLSNEGTETLHDISAKVVGDGLQHLTSTSLSVLKPEEEDSVTVKVNVLKSGTLNGTVKVMDKRFPISFTVAGEIVYSKEDLEIQLKDLKQKLQEQEIIYQEKKAEGYLVTEVFDSVKNIKDNLQKAQQNILTRKYIDARVNLDLAATGINDVTASLREVRKQEQTFLQWLKENVVTIAAIITGLGAVSGFLIKMGMHAKKVGKQAKEASESALQKVGEKVKKKMSASKPEEGKNAQETTKGSKENKKRVAENAPQKESSPDKKAESKLESRKESNEEESDPNSEL